MRTKRFLVTCCMMALFAWAPSNSQAATQGFRECTELCYMKECGQVGVKCPTQTQKSMYRRMCYGKCKEKVRRQRVEEMLRVERIRSNRYRSQLILRHKLWLQKKQTTHKIRMQWLAAKQRRQTQAATAHYRRMLTAMQDQLQVMHQKLYMKESFYSSRRRLRQKQRSELLFQVRRLKKRLHAVKSSKNSPEAQDLKRKIKQYKKREITRYKQASKLRVEFFKTRVRRRKYEVKQIRTQKKALQQSKNDAKKKNDQKKIDALAKRLGELAGRQAAVTQKADLERIKLEQARTAYLSASRRTL